jgi:hypothetical protein
MITNAGDAGVGQRLERARGAFPAAAAVLDALAGHPDPFSFRTEMDGMEFAAERPVDARPNRAVLKVFSVGDGPMSGRTAVFFYKRSQVPWSRDRYSYGVAILSPDGADPREIAGWLDYASTGFDPDAKPVHIRQAVTFNVPD